MTALRQRCRSLSRIGRARHSTSARRSSWSGALFTTFTHITPSLEDVGGLSLAGLFAALIVASVALALVAGAGWAAMAVLPFWGATMFGCGPGLQTSVIDQSIGAPTLASP